MEGQYRETDLTPEEITRDSLCKRTSEAERRAQESYLRCINERKRKNARKKVALETELNYISDIKED